MAGTSRPHPFSVTLTDAGYAASGEILTDDVMAYGETVGRSRPVVVGAMLAPTTTHEGHAVLAVLASRLGAAPTARLWRGDRRRAAQRLLGRLRPGPVTLNTAACSSGGETEQYQ